MKLKNISVAVAAALISTSVSAVDFNGYFRSGVGVNLDGGAQVDGNKNFVGRLGNETDTYSEIALGKEVYNKDGRTFRVNSRVSITDTNGSADYAGEFGALREFNVVADLGSATIWGGKRFYQRKDIHITDHYYVNNSGHGFGVENIQTGLGDWAFAWTQTGKGSLQTPEGVDPNSVVNKLDVRWQNIQMGDSNTLEVIGIYAMPSESKDANLNPGQDKDGIFGTVEWTASYGLGFNKLAVQYMTNGFLNDGTGYNSDGGWYAVGREGTGYQLIDWGVLSVSPQFEMGYSLVYSQNDVEGQGENTRFSGVIRPQWFLGEISSIVAELGTTHFDDANGTTGSSQKYTIAHQWSAGQNFWARPAIRVFYSHLTGDDFNTPNAENMVGAQVEAWW